MHADLLHYYATPLNLKETDLFIAISAASVSDIHMGLNYPDLVLDYSHSSLWKSRGFR